MGVAYDRPAVGTPRAHDKEKNMEENTKVVAIDPGMTTGVAILDHEGRVVLHTTIAFKTVEQFATELTPLSLLERPFHVVAEKGPANRTSPVLEAIDAVIREMFPGVAWMRPSEWKRTPQSRERFPGLNKHSRDAARMGRRFMVVGT